MKMRTAILALMVFGFLVTFNTVVRAASAASPKIGFFDLQTVLDQSKAGKSAKEDFKVEKEKIRSEMDEKGKAFKAARDEFEKKKSVMDEKAKTQKTKDLAQMQQEGEKLVMESNAKLNKVSSDLMAPIVDKVLEIVRKMGKEEKYDYIIESGKGGIVYGNDKDDITKKVIEELDKHPPLKK